MKLSSGEAVTIKRGYYFILCEMSSGSTSAVASIHGMTGQDISEFTFSASGVARVYLPECTLTPTLTGDAELAIEPIALDTR